MGLFHFLKKKHSSDQARDRLKLLLVSDRADCSPEILEMIRRDLVQVISRYVEIDTEELEIQITQIKDRNGKNMVPVLFANIPIRGGGLQSPTGELNRNPRLSGSGTSNV